MPDKVDFQKDNKDVVNMARRISLKRKTAMPEEDRKADVRRIRVLLAKASSALHSVSAFV